jgi:peptidoglycan/LPS O-acetylase OafA/YrhL
MEYRREIDGLRALAVLSVIFFHAGFAPFSGGFVGVDVFFVISGYLITSIILAEKKANSFTLLHFYERRARRILPALFAVMFASLMCAFMWLNPEHLKYFSQSLVAISGLSSNVLFYLTSGYFEVANVWKPLLHTWSLAVEEQFYLVFPVLLLLIWRWGKTWLLVLLASLGVISLGAAQWSSASDPTFAFFMLPTRAWELLIGSLIAIYSDRNRITTNLLVRQFLSVCGLLLILFAVFAYDKNTPFPSLYALLPTIGVSLIILFTTPETLAGQVLGNRWLVGIGLISYSAYLWHQPVFVFARFRSTDEPSKLFITTLTLLVFPLSYLSWRYIETPFRKGHHFTRKQVFSLAASCSVIFIVIGLIGQWTNGFYRFYLQNLTEPQKSAYQLIQRHTGPSMQMFDNGECVFWGQQIDEAIESRFRSCSERYGKAIVVLGDSHAMNVYNAFAKAEFKNFLVGVTRGGCRPHTDLPNCHYSGFNNFVARNRNHIDFVVFHQSGAYLIKDLAGMVYYDSAFKNDISQFELHEPNIKGTSAYLENLSKYVNVVWLGPFIEARVRFTDPRRFNKGFKLNENSLALFSQLDKNLKSILSVDGLKYRYIPFSELIEIDQDFLLVGDCLTFRDADHFSGCGEMIVGKRIQKVFGNLFVTA